MSSSPVVIVGAGIAGLSCARSLVNEGVDVRIVDRDTRMGGRVRTDQVDGFRLDHGFQVLQTGYPEARRQLDFERLNLQAFEPGALIQTATKAIPMVDPWRRPGQAWATCFNGVGTLADRWRLARLRRRVTRLSLEQLAEQPDLATADYLKETCGFSADMIDRFFRPWFAGVFLESDLSSSRRFFDFTFRMFALGDAALPENGMGAIAAQLGETLTTEQLRLGECVESLAPGCVKLTTGEQLSASAIVLAVDAQAAQRLAPQINAPTRFGSTCCFQFAARHAPFEGGWLVLNGTGAGPINHLCVPSNVSRGYAPAGESLVSVSTVGTARAEELESEVLRQLENWYGTGVRQWRLLTRQSIPHAVPLRSPGFTPKPSAAISDGLYCCGDYTRSPSIQGALESGRGAAEAVLARMKSSAA